MKRLIIGLTTMAIILASASSLSPVLGLSVQGNMQSVQNQTNYNNTSYYFGGETYWQEEINLKNFLAAKHMDDSANKLLQQDEQNQRDMAHTIWLQNLPTVNQSMQFQESRLALAKSGNLTWDEVQGRSWYDQEQSDIQKQILNEVKLYLKDGRNGTPDFTTCEVWNSCPTNATSIHH